MNLSNLPTQKASLTVDGHVWKDVTIARFKGELGEDGRPLGTAPAAYAARLERDEVWLADGKDVLVASRRGIAKAFPFDGEHGKDVKLEGKAVKAFRSQNHIDTVRDWLIAGPLMAALWVVKQLDRLRGR